MRDEDNHLLFTFLDGCSNIACAFGLGLLAEMKVKVSIHYYATSCEDTKRVCSYFAASIPTFSDQFAAKLVKFSQGIAFENSATRSSLVEPVPELQFLASSS